MKIFTKEQFEEHNKKILSEKEDNSSKNEISWIDIMYDFLSDIKKIKDDTQIIESELEKKSESDHTHEEFTQINDKISNLKENISKIKENISSEIKNVKSSIKHYDDNPVLERINTIQEEVKTLEERVSWIKIPEINLTGFLKEKDIKNLANKKEVYNKEETYNKDEVYTKKEVYNKKEIDERIKNNQWWSTSIVWWASFMWDLQDVKLSNTEDWQILVYDEVTKRWKNATAWSSAPSAIHVNYSRIGSYTPTVERDNYLYLIAPSVPNFWSWIDFSFVADNIWTPDDYYLQIVNPAWVSWSVVYPWQQTVDLSTYTEDAVGIGVYFGLLSSVLKSFKLRYLDTNNEIITIWSNFDTIQGTLYMMPYNMLYNLTITWETIILYNGKYYTDKMIEITDSVKISEINWYIGNNNFVSVDVPINDRISVEVSKSYYSIDAIDDFSTWWVWFLVLPLLMNWSTFEFTNTSGWPKSCNLYCVEGTEWWYFYVYADGNFSQYRLVQNSWSTVTIWWLTAYPLITWIKYKVIFDKDTNDYKISEKIFVKRKVFTSNANAIAWWLVVWDEYIDLVGTIKQVI